MFHSVYLSGLENIVPTFMVVKGLAHEPSELRQQLTSYAFEPVEPQSNRSLSNPVG